MGKPVFAGFSRDENGRRQLGQRVAIYCRVSTDDQSCERQERDLRAFAERAGHEVVGVFMEKASGARNDRQERKKVMALAQGHEIDAILAKNFKRFADEPPEELPEIVGEERVEKRPRVLIEHQQGLQPVDTRAASGSGCKRHAHRLARGDRIILWQR